MAAIFGCAGLTLSEVERTFFAETNPLGFILFARNVETPDQVRALVADLRSSVGRGDAPVLIDQEGGRVQRLRPPHWRQAPTGADLVAVYQRDRAMGLEAAMLNAQLIAAELMDLGIDVNCAPVLDVPQPGAHDIIGDRAHGDDPPTVIALGRAVAGGLHAGGVMSVAKHIPGHGRALADSHHDLPIVDAPHSDLVAIDFAPFKALSDLPWGMTAHVVYTALDAKNPATTSGVVIADVIRGEIGFQGFLVSDDLSMKALQGSFEDRTTACLNAGCDAVLHCNGDMNEMQTVARVARPMTEHACERLKKARQVITIDQTFDADAALLQLTAILAL